MAVTTLDPKAALMVVDLQQGIVSLPTAHPLNDVVKRARALADAFRARRLPVVLVVFPRLGETGATDEIIALMERIA